MNDDSELGDFNPQNDSGSDHEQAVEEAQQEAAIQGESPQELIEEPAQPPTLAQQRLEASDHDRQIRPGDVVRDLWGGGWQIVFQKKADTVAEYDQMQDDTKKSLLEYEGNKAMGATERDTVWQVFYLNKNNTLAGGRSGPYSFPESRICRYAYESTDGWKAGRFQDHIQMQVFERLLMAADDTDAVHLAISRAFTEEDADQAFELMEAAAGDH